LLIWEWFAASQGAQTALKVKTKPNLRARGIFCFYAGGKSYTYTGPEDVGNLDDQDTDFCTTLGIYKNGQLRSISPSGVVKM
jgi:hypothetical protein